MSYFNSILLKMAGTYDSEKQRVIDRIKCIAFREARDAGATFINRKWIARGWRHHQGRRGSSNVRRNRPGSIFGGNVEKKLGDCFGKSRKQN